MIVYSRCPKCPSGGTQSTPITHKQILSARKQLPASNLILCLAADMVSTWQYWPLSTVDDFVDVRLCWCYQLGQVKGLLASCTLPKIWNLCSQKWNSAALFPISTLMYLWAIYMVLGRQIVVIYKSLTDTWMWNWETEYYKSVLEMTRPHSLNS